MKEVADRAKPGAFTQIRIGGRKHSLPPLSVSFMDLPKDDRGRRVWVCAMCLGTGKWDESWSSYGSLYEQEAGFCVPTCSETCRATYDRFRETKGRTNEHR
jgi:hypothetical protein